MKDCLAYSKDDSNVCPSNFTLFDAQDPITFEEALQEEKWKILCKKESIP